MEKRYLSIAVFSFIILIMLFSMGCQNVKTITEKETISFQAVNKDDPNKWEGEEEETQAGENGEKEVTYKIIENGNNPPEKEFVSEKVIRSPKDRIVSVGTKSRVTGKNYKSKNLGAEISITKITREIDDKWNGDAPLDTLAIEFNITNISDNYISVFPQANRSITLFDGKNELGPNMRSADSKDLQNVAVDETANGIFYFSLKENKSAKVEKALNKNIKGPKDLEIYFGTYYGGFSGDKREKMPLTYFWVGPFYEE